MDTTSCTIQLEDSKEIYRPGEVITGLVFLNINCTNHIFLKALSLQFSGYAHTKWEKPTAAKKLSKTQPTSLMDYREDFVSTTSYLIGSEMANARRFEPGKYSYSFMINIPANIPSTFDSTLGFIRYEFLINADYGDHKTTLCHMPVKIEQLKDLRLLDSWLQLPVDTQQLELKSHLKFWQQPLQLDVSIPQAAFIVGEYVSLNIKLTNPSQLKIQTITGNLNRMASYKNLTREKRAEITTEATTIASSHRSLSGQNLRQMQLLLEINIPNTPPTLTFDECKCISLSYELEVLVTVHNKKRWLRAIVPILIGSVSLTSDAKMLPSNFNSQNVAAIRIAKSIEELTLPSFTDVQGNLSAIQTANLSASASSLASSFQEANFMTAVQLNKKSRNQIVGDLKNFKPKYLYYDFTDELTRNHQNDTSLVI